MGQKILGLDLGSYSIKGTLIERTWQDFSVLDYFERANESDPALNPFQQLNYNLQKFLEEHPLPPDTLVMASMPGHLLQYRILEIPLANSKKIEQAMEFELENYIPFDLEKVWFDYHVLSIEKGTSRILCAYTQLEDFKGILNVYLQNGLNPRQLSGDAADLVYLAHVAMLPQDGQYALVDFGHKKTSIVIMDGQRPRYIRSLVIGSNTITHAIAEHFAISEGEADLLKQEKAELHAGNSAALGEGEEAQFAKLVHDLVQHLIVNIRQTFAAYAEEHRDNQVQALYLLGGGSRLKGLQQALASNLKMNVTTLDSLAFTPHRLADPDKVMMSCPQSFATALKALNWPRQLHLNFRKADFAYRGDVEGLSYGVKRAAIWLAVILGIAIFHYEVSHFMLSRKVNSVRAEAKEVLGKDWASVTKGKGFSLNSALSMVGGKTAELQEKLASISGNKDELSPLLVLREISRQVPKKDQVKMDIDNLNITEDLVRIEGKTNSFEAVDLIKQSLAGSKYFHNVKMDNVAKGLRDEVKFTLSFDLKEKQEG